MINKWLLRLGLAALVLSTVYIVYARAQDMDAYIVGHTAYGHDMITDTCPGYTVSAKVQEVSDRYFAEKYDRYYRGYQMAAGVWDRRLKFLGKARFCKKYVGKFGPDGLGYLIAKKQEE